MNKRGRNATLAIDQRNIILSDRNIILQMYTWWTCVTILMNIINKLEQFYNFPKHTPVAYEY